MTLRVFDHGSEFPLVRFRIQVCTVFVPCVHFECADGELCRGIHATQDMSLKSNPSATSGHRMQQPWLCLELDSNSWFFGG